GNIRKHSIESLRTVMQHLGDACDGARAIEYGKCSYLDATVMGKFVRLVLQEAGEQMEQSLCNLGIIEETDAGYFVDNLKREGQASPVQEMAHG
ncbi:MAG TPA: hypothetical protein VJT81_00420, partial [Burkholderiales bacterium]|nr:hypothetical protein [Burkholderiales bacterium]